MAGPQRCRMGTWVALRSNGYRSTLDPASMWLVHLLGLVIISEPFLRRDVDETAKSKVREYGRRRLCHCSTVATKCAVKCCGPYAPSQGHTDQVFTFLQHGDLDPGYGGPVFFSSSRDLAACISCEICTKIRLKIDRILRSNSGLQMRQHAQDFQTLAGKRSARACLRMHATSVTSWASCIFPEECMEAMRCSVSSHSGRL